MWNRSNPHSHSRMPISVFCHLYSVFLIFTPCSMNYNSAFRTIPHATQLVIRIRNPKTTSTNTSMDICKTGAYTKNMGTARAGRVEAASHTPAIGKFHGFQFSGIESDRHRLLDSRTRSLGRPLLLRDLCCILPGPKIPGDKPETFLLSCPLDPVLHLFSAEPVKL